MHTQQQYTLDQLQELVRCGVIKIPANNTLASNPELHYAPENNNNFSGALCMIGKIRTVDKCPKCKKMYEFIGNDIGLLCKKCHTRPKTYYINYWWKGKERNIYSYNGNRLTDFFGTLRLLVTINQEIENHKKGISTFDPDRYLPKKIKEYSFNHVANQWFQNKLDRQRQNDLAPSYTKELERYVRKYFIPFFGGKDIREIRNIDIKNFRKQLPENQKLKTIKNIMDALRNLFIEFKEDYECLDKIPKFPKIKYQKYVCTWLTPDEQDAIYQHLPEEHYAIFYFIRRTGVRTMEAAALQKQDLDIKNNMAIIRRSFSDGKLREVTKQKEWGVVYLDDGVMKACFDKKKILAMKPNDFIFTHNYRGKVTSYSHSTIEYWWAKAKLLAGTQGKLPLKDATRHSLASQAINRGVPLKYVSGALRHSNQKITEEVYAHLLKENLKEVFSDPKTRCKPDTIDKVAPLHTDKKEDKTGPNGGRTRVFNVRG